MSFWWMVAAMVAVLAGAIELAVVAVAPRCATAAGPAIGSVSVILIVGCRGSTP